MRDKRYISLGFLFIGVFVMSLFVVNAGDDFFYASFSRNGIGQYIGANIHHYTDINGRCIVHLLASLFLWLPHIVWKILNAGMWVAIAMNFYRLINLYVKDIRKLKFIMFMLCGAFLTIHIEMAKESTLWLTGSFNYTYPLMMFCWYWYLLLTNEKQSTKKLCIVGFLAAASMEQEAALTVILTLGYIFIKKKPPTPKLKKAAIITIIGALSLFIAPGNILRMGDEIGSSSGTFDNILNGFDFMLNYCISSNYMLWPNIVFMLCCAIFLGRNEYKIFSILLPFEIVALFITNHSGEFEWMGVVYGIIFWLSRVYYFASAISAVYLYFEEKNNPIPLISLGFGIFSCAFIVISPTLGARVVLFAEVMIIICIVLFMSALIKPNTRFYRLVHIIVIVLSLTNIVYITHGFYKNSLVYRENEKLVEQWHKNGGELVQKQYRNYEFEHSMPYNSEYHDGRYREYYGIPLDEKIKWE